MPSGKPSLNLPLESWVSVAVSGVFTGAMALVMCVAFGALIFSGPLAPVLSHGIALGIVGCTLVGVLGSCFSGSTRVIFQPDDDTAPVYALLVATLVGTLPAVDLDQLVVIAVLAVVSTTMLTGLTLTLLGRFHFGSSVEYLPYSVMGGYFAAAGWLLVLGAIKLIVPELPDDPLQALRSMSAHTVECLSMLGMALVIFLLRSRIPNSVLLPGAALLAIGAFYSVAALQGLSLAQLSNGGWLIGPFEPVNADILHPLVTLPLAEEHFRLLLSSSETIAVIVLLSVMSTMLTVSGLGLLSREDLSVDRELKVIGSVNMLNGFFGGLATLPSLSLTALSAEVGAPKSRWVGIAAALFSLLFFVLALELLGFIPRLVIGGLLLYLGLAFLKEWLIDSRNKYPLHEYLVIPIILVVAATIGFLQGVLVGLLAAVILFVVKYSQINVVRFEGDGRQFRSNVERSPAEQQYLQQRGDEVLTLGLQGYLFFGTAGSVYRQLKEQLDERERSGAKKIGFIILDFSQVTGVDASASLNFEKLSQLVTLNHVYLLLAGLPDSLRTRIANVNDSAEELVYVNFVDDFDFALEWCEKRLLSQMEQSASSNTGFLKKLQQQSQQSYHDFLSYLQVLEVEEGYVLTAQGEESHSLFFLESCSASAYIDDEHGGKLRVRRTDQGTIYGEIGFYLDTARTASVITDNAGKVYVLSRTRLADMEKQHPALATQFQNHMLSMVIERLFLTTQTLKTVLR